MALWDTSELSDGFPQAYCITPGMSADRHRLSPPAPVFGVFARKSPPTCRCGPAVDGTLIAQLGWGSLRSPDSSLMSKRESSAAAIDPTVDQYDRLLSRFATAGFPPLIIAVGLSHQLLDALDRHNASCHVLAVEPLPAR